MLTFSGKSWILFVLIIFNFVLQAKASDSIKVHADAPYVAHKKINQRFFFYTEIKQFANLELHSYYYSKNDSILIFKKQIDSFLLEKGASSIPIAIENHQSGSFKIDQKFKKAILKTETLPVGDYKTFISLSNSHDSILYSDYIQFSSDSMLAENSILYKRLITSNLIR